MLVCSCYGNYTIQTILEYWGNSDCEPISNVISKHLHCFSLQKYSSNVVEKFLERQGESAVTVFINEICQKTKLLGKVYFI
jgi:hypothetical protein